MGRPSWRWGAVAALVAVLVALPSLAGLLPASAGTPDPAALLERVRGSADVAWSGYGESTGSLALPDVRELDELPALLGGTTRTRTWWRGPQDLRVDALTPVGERDVVVDAGGTWLWDSADRRAVRLLGEPEVRLPREADLVAPVLGRRLARTPGLEARPLPGRRVAGRPTAGLRLVPPRGSATTVDRVDLLVEPATGLVLAVEVVAGGAGAVRARLLELSLERPPGSRTAFTPPPTASTEHVEVPDLAAAVHRFAPYLLPDELARLPRRDRVDGLAGATGVGTYGEGLTALALVPLPRDVGRRALRRVDPQDDDGLGRVSTPLLNAVVLLDGRRAYLLAGTVPAAVLDVAVAQLRADPPVRLR